MVVAVNAVASVNRELGFCSSTVGEPQHVRALSPPPMQYIKEHTEDNIQEDNCQAYTCNEESYTMFGISSNVAISSSALQTGHQTASS